MRRFRTLVVVISAMALIAAACGGDDAEETTTTTAATGDTTDDGMVDVAGTEFTLFGAPVGDEGKAMEGFLDAYNAEKGTNIGFTGSDDFESQLRIRVDGGDPPDVAMTPQPGSICPFADEGALTSLEDMGFDIAEMEANHGKFWMDLGVCADGEHYGIPWFPNFKSIVFYHAPTFEANGYAIPETWDDMISLSEQVVADGLTPWCFGFESGGATGWAGTDWIEDILVREAGVDLYTQWFKHEIPFNDPAVVSAFDTFGELIFGDGFVLGGAENIAGVSVTDSPGPLFNDPPGCLMLKQGSFARNWMVDLPNYSEEGINDIKVFPFPTIDGNTGAMGGGDTLIVFNGTPQVAQIVKDWITPEWFCTLASPGGGGVATYGGHGVAGIERLPGHKDVDLDCYETEQSRVFAEAITTALAANTFVFDGGDLMPPAVGQGSFWTGMVDFTRGTSAQEVADAIEASWP